MMYEAYIKLKKKSQIKQTPDKCFCQCRWQSVRLASKIDAVVDSSCLEQNICLISWVTKVMGQILQWQYLDLG
jgi:hypothetical protein